LTPGKIALFSRQTDKNRRRDQTRLNMLRIILVEGAGLISADRN
jgi:hypothetical protein